MYGQPRTKYGTADPRAQHWVKAIQLKPDTAEYKQFGSAAAYPAAPPAAVTRKDVMTENIEMMNRLEGFDVVIVCTSTVQQASFWQQRLTSTLGSISPRSCKICAVDEDWAPGGAGNGLGTLYAFSKARKLAVELYGIDIYKGMQSGKLAVGMYHTAGKGTRLAPIPGAENNNKPGVKLPSVVQTTSGQSLPLTILEAVIKQTGVYAASRKGRLSVFWGDQVFIPSVTTRYTSQHHADILAQMGPMPSKAEWEAGGYSNYGLIATGSNGEGAQVEKVTYDQATSLLKGLGTVTECGPSLGSFSVSAPLLGGLMKEFAAELKAKEVALDSDPHFWMPMTLSLKDYVAIMGTKKTSPEEATAHYARVQHIKKKLPKSMKVFGAVSVGKEGYWWDYGQVKFYLDNNMIMAQKSAEADAMRLFFGVTDFDGSSTVLSSRVGRGSRVSGSVLVGVHTKKASLNSALLMNVTAPSVTGTNCVVYNVVSDKPINLGDGDVMVGMQIPDGDYIIMRSHLKRDGKTDWKERHSGNPFSYKEVYDANGSADPTDIDEQYQKMHADQQKKQ